MNWQALTVFPIPQFALVVLILTLLGWWFAGWVGALCCFVIPIVLGIVFIEWLMSLMPH
jgi:hypothetical protein